MTLLVQGHDYIHPGVVMNFSTSWPKRPVVYILANADRERLYIGSTDQLALRLAKHKSATPWWPEVAFVAWVVIRGSIDLARRVETRAIWRCRPPKNERVDRPRGLGKPVRTCRHRGLPYLQAA